MALKHYVTPKNTGNQILRHPDAKDLAYRNERYQKLKRAAIMENYFDENTEKNYNEKMKQDFRRRANMVPYVVKNLTNEAYSLFPELIFREYFTKLVTESLRPTPDEFGKPKGIWDKELVDECTSGIRYMCHSYIKSLGGLKYLKETVRITNSDYLKKVYDVCMESGKKIANKKKVKLEKETNPGNVEETSLDLSIDTEDEEMLNKNLNSLNVEDISELVKDKVLEVVKDEEVSHEKEMQTQNILKEEIKAAKAKQEIPEELPRTINNGDADSSTSDSSTNASDSGADAAASGATATKDASGDSEDTKETDTEDTEKDTDKATKESIQHLGIMHKWALNNRMDLQTSLLKSLTMRCYQSAIKEGSAIAAAAIKNPINGERRVIPPAALNIYDAFLTSENQDLDYIDFARNSQKPAIASTNSGNIDSEEILEQSFAEALGLFTALECAYSIKLISPSETEVKRTIMYNINQKN